MKRGGYLIIIVVIITFISSSEVNAIVSIRVSESIKGTREAYTISGEITSMDVTQVKNIFQSKGTMNPPFFHFYLDSSGGDINAAMEIGKLIRKARATCWIYPGAKCYSACVFVLSGAVKRIVHGEVGIHRPYSAYVGRRDYESTQNEYRRTETAVRAYFREMNLPGQLFEAMVLVPPEKIRILSDKELEAFGLSGTDPVEQDTQDATDASYYGISKTECIRRKASLDRVCGSFQDFALRYMRDSGSANGCSEAYSDCTSAYMFGLDLPTYKARKARAVNKCSGYKPGEEYGSCYLGVLREGR